MIPVDLIAMASINKYMMIVPVLSHTYCLFVFVFQFSVHVVCSRPLQVGDGGEAHM